jgi:PAS domain-containing protein
VDLAATATLHFLRLHRRGRRVQLFDGVDVRDFGGVMEREPVHDESGAVTVWCGTNLDIDDRRCAEDAVRESQRDLSLIVDSIPGLVFTLFPSGELEFVNRRVQEYFGRSAAYLNESSGS